MMTVKRFKWVNTQTGEEHQDNSISMSFDVLNSIGEPIPGFRTFKSVPEWLSKVVTENVAKPCQSTGLTDDAGVEIFYGDILCDRGDDVQSLWEVVSHRAQPYGFLFPDTTSKFELYGMLKERKSNPLYMLHGDMTFYVIGNRWQPAEELKARAEAVSNG